MEIYKRAWFINFIGIGNGITIIPLLQCFENNHQITEYFHSENKILSDKWFTERAGLKRLRGFSPISWRRFKRENWNIITDFINQNQVDLVVNLRNEGPKYDTGYYEFKEFIKQKQDVTFWDLDFDIIEKRKKQKNLTGDLLNLFHINGVDISDHKAQWLFAHNDDKTGFGFGMAASQKNKRWPKDKWIELAQKILANYDQKVVLFPGLSQEETDQAMEVQKSVGPSNCEIINRQELSSVAVMLGKLKCFISNDTGLLHICSATGTPTIGLYTSTDPNIWAPYNKTNFSSCTNTFMKECPARKIYCGNCFHYYDPCPAITQHGDSIKPNQILELVKK